MGKQKETIREANYKKKISGTVAVQRFQTLKQNRRQEKKLTWEELVRMRSPVQIWSAAPLKSLKSSDLGDFCYIFATFRGRLRI